MKVLFFYPVPAPRYNIIRYQYGLGYLSSILKKAGNHIRLDYIYDYNEGRLSSIINDFKPDLIGLTVMTNQFDLSSQITRYIHTRYNLPIVWGGIHPTVSPEESLSCEGVMGICVGEGEGAVLEFVERLGRGEDFTSTKNFWFKMDGRIIKNENRPLVKDLDLLPFPDREVFNYQRLLNDYPQVDIITSRGCPFKCTYCVNSYLNRISNNRLIRQRSVQNVITEIDNITGNYSRIQTIAFADDIFGLDKSWLKQFSREYSQKFSIPYWCNARADSIDQERISYLKASGCEQINIGIESGNDYIRKEVMQRNISREKIKQSFLMVKKSGIRVWAFNMIGLPFETVDTIKETINLNREIKPDSIFCSIFYPYPGTELHDFCKSHGWISNRELTSYFAPASILDLPTISHKDIFYYYENFKGLVLYPKLESLIEWLARLKIGPDRSIYSLIRTIDWKLTRFASKLFPKRVKDSIKSLVRSFRNLMARRVT